MKGSRGDSSWRGYYRGSAYLSAFDEDTRNRNKASAHRQNIVRVKESHIRVKDEFFSISFVNSKEFCGLF